MKRAFSSMPKKPEHLLVDGFKPNDVNYPEMRIFEGDKRNSSVEEASLTAEVFQDEIFTGRDSFFCVFTFNKKKGYESVQTFKALQELGANALHRLPYWLMGIQ